MKKYYFIFKSELMSNISYIANILVGFIGYFLMLYIFLTSHDVGDIEKLCKRVIIINNGQIVLDDSMENLKYHYLNKKIVDAKMKEKVNLDDEEGITILKDKGYNLKIEVDTKKRSVSDAIKLLNPDNIVDINISNVPLEDIISSIYKNESEK
jgi:ABC-2 type transport system ATP-binding protein